MLAGYADIDITPAPGEEMTGYGYFLNRRATGTLDPLMARALALGDGQVRAAIVQLDLLGLSKEFVAHVRAEAQGRFGLAPEQLMLHCTHTHSGPATMPLIGVGNPSEYYPRELTVKLLDVIGRALDDLKPAAKTNRFACDFPDGFAHNRVGGTDLDTRIRGLRVEVEGGRPIVVISYACHPVVLGRNDDYSADYVGHVIAELNAYGTRAVYLNGCCGDINPASNAYRFGSGKQETLRIYGRDLAARVKKAMQDGTPWEPGPLRACSRMIPLDMQMPDAASMQATLGEHREAVRENPNNHQARVEVMWLERMIGLEAAGKLQEAMSAEVQAIACGDVVFVAVSGETFTRLGQTIRGSAPEHHLMIAATSNGLLGYIATPEDAGKQGYASFAACKLYGMPLPTPDAGLMWAAAGGDVVREAIG